MEIPRKRKTKVIQAKKPKATEVKSRSTSPADKKQPTRKQSRLPTQSKYCPISVLQSHSRYKSKQYHSSVKIVPLTNNGLTWPHSSYLILIFHLSMKKVTQKGSPSFSIIHISAPDIDFKPWKVHSSYENCHLFLHVSLKWVLSLLVILASRNSPRPAKTPRHPAEYLTATWLQPGRLAHESSLHDSKILYQTGRYIIKSQILSQNGTMW